MYIVMDIFFRTCNRILKIFYSLFTKLFYGKKIYIKLDTKLHITTKISISKNSSIFLGSNVSSRKNLLLMATHESKDKEGGVIRIGANCFFNSNCSVVAMRMIEIGNDCIFGENVHIYDHNHNYKEKNRLIREQGFSVNPVKIGNNCWIGTNVVILKGITIGNNSIIGAGCVVHKNVPANSILLSNGRCIAK